tara:strand:- start:366 stop:581 length:216 start_codon:yes stop_codon:yes gene_type:complete
MIISILDRYLPIELVDKIYRMVFEMNMRDIREIINYKIVFTIYEENRLSFLVCEFQNYYMVLDNNQFGTLM